MSATQQLAERAGVAGTLFRILGQASQHDRVDVRVVEVRRRIVQQHGHRASP